MKQSVRTIVLAAGKSTRLQTGRTKLVEKICGQEMILYITKLLQEIDIPTTIVVGYDKEKVINTITTHHNDYFQFIEQKEQLGTGHALTITADAWDAEHILILHGDIPLITSDLITQLYDEHTQNNAAISFVVSYLEEPNHPYARVFKENNQISIIENRDLTLNDPRQDHPWINAGIYIVNTKFLQESIEKFTINNTLNEFYITDLINIANEEQETIITVQAPFDTVRGVNTFEELWAVETIKQKELISFWMDKGVRFASSHNIHIDMQVSIGTGSYIASGVHLQGETIIGNNSTVHEFCSIQNSIIGNNVQIYSHSIVAYSTIDDKSKVGPFAYVRENVIIDKDIPVAIYPQTNNSSTQSQGSNFNINTTAPSQTQTKTKKFSTVTNTKTTAQKKSSLFTGAYILQEDFPFHEDQ